MTEGSGLVDNIRALVGLTAEPVVMSVERGAIKRFCEAVGDSNPLFTDEEYAKNSPYGDITCPPGFFGWPMKPPPRTTMPEPQATMVAEFAKAGFPGLLDGAIDYEFYMPIYPGDVIVSSAKIADIYEREGKSGKSLFGVIQITYMNQNGDIVCKVMRTLIGRLS